ncbi:MAG: glycosyltransferase family 4 protein [Candidatus Eremiobacteraeota bacterium]|nr:glycosyltransferase family 4 protein [Candidatus Eremiobacteraeota bacterium]
MTSRPKRVALVTRLPIDAAGGIESAVRELAPRIAARRPDWDVVLVHAFARAGRWNRIPFVGDLVAAIVLAAKLRRCDAAVINGAEYAWPRMLRKRDRDRTVVVWHGTRAGEIPALVPAMSLAVRVYWLLEIWLQRWALRARGQVAVSETTRAEIVATYRPRRAIAVVPNGAPDEVGVPRTRSGRGRRVVWIGTNAYKKGLDIALAACEAARTDIPDLELVPIGIALSAPERAARPWVHDRGRVSHSESMELLASGDVLLATSRYEGCSVAIIEALTLGIPIVAGPSVGWMVGGGGIAVESFGAERYARVLRSVLTSPERLQALSREARCQARRFDWEAAAEAYAGKIDACLAE